MCDGAEFIAAAMEILGLFEIRVGREAVAEGDEWKKRKAELVERLVLED